MAAVYPRFLDLASLDRALDDVLATAFRTAPPTSLCHYTDWEGLEGILTSRELWAVDFRAQRTDEREFQHADQVILETAAEVAAESIMSHRHAELLKQTADQYPQQNVVRSSDEELFITSFCTTPDNASVWESFGGRGTGFAIEFAIRHNERVDTPAMAVVAAKVDYQLDAVRARLRQVFCQALDRRALYAGSDVDKADQYTLRSLWMLATRTAAQYKSSEYAPNCEWRRLVFAPKRHRFDVSPPLLPVVHRAPKVHVKVAIRPGKARPKLNAIHIGAHAPVGAETDVAELLATLGYIGKFSPLVKRVKIDLHERE